jgi:chaperone BCS1
VSADTELARIFTTLPPKCIVLLEDIDAVGRSREARAAEEEDDDKKRSKRHSFSSNPQSRSMCTLSGLLNVLDGVASQEGRIVLMTSNFADQLDKALIRPGRIDKLILLSYINKESARLMFLRMFARETDNDNDNDNDDENNKKHSGNETSDEELQNLALQFSNEIPEGKLTPAQLQGYLLNHRTAPKPALAGIARWVADELAILEKEKQAAAEAALAREKRKNKDRMKALVQDLIDIRDVETEGVPEPAPAQAHPPAQAAGEQSVDIIITPTKIVAAALDKDEPALTSPTNKEGLVIATENSTRKEEKDHASEGGIGN